MSIGCLKGVLIAILKSICPQTMLSPLGALDVKFFTKKGAHPVSHFLLFFPNFCSICFPYFLNKLLYNKLHFHSNKLVGTLLFLLSCSLI